ncbi:MAG: hypothetical protein QOE17_2271, partial [Gaiellales bacterium]|nr:hypothetical protein [Gaiellales bacterium]
RGTTLVEYALGVALIAIVLIVSINFTQGKAKSELVSKGGSIGHPTIEGAAASTTTTTTTTPPTSTTATTAPPAYSGSIGKQCQNGKGSDTCAFSLNPPPDPAFTIVWSIQPATGYSPTTLPGDPSITVRFNTQGTRTIQATVNGVAVSPAITVDCDKNLKCN